MSATLRVGVAGGTGWAGRALVPAILDASDLSLVAVVARRSRGRSLREALGVSSDLTISGTVLEALERTPMDVLVDYTHPDAVRGHVETALQAGAACVIGTSGLDDGDYEAIHQQALRHRRGVLAGGNFSMAAALQQQFAILASKYLRHWEVFDYAHAEKPDAPSGMTRELAFLLKQAGSRNLEAAEGSGTENAARGLRLNGTRIHSVRLPGFVIGAEVVLAEGDQRLSIRYDAGADASAYVEGTLRAVRVVTSFVGLRRGLASLLEGGPEPPAPPRP